MNWWEDQINNPNLAIIHKTPEEILRNGLEDMERDGLGKQMGSTAWKQGIKAGSILDKAYGKDRT